MHVAHGPDGGHSWVSTAAHHILLQSGHTVARNVQSWSAQLEMGAASHDEVAGRRMARGRHVVYQLRSLGHSSDRTELMPGRHSSSGAGKAHISLGRLRQSL